MVNNIPYHSEVLSICINKNFRFRSPLSDLSERTLFRASESETVLLFSCPLIVASLFIVRICKKIAKLKIAKLLRRNKMWPKSSKRF